MKRAASRQPRVVAGFKTFFVCVVLAGILGSAVRLYFSPPRIESFLRQQIARQKLPVKIDFKSAHLTLARGLLPTFAFDIVDVTISHFAPCPSEPFAEARVLVLPLDWWSLFKGKLQLGFVITDGVTVSADRAKCSIQRDPIVHDTLIDDEASFQYPAIEESRGTIVIPRALAQTKTWFRSEDLERARNVLAGLEIQNGIVYFDNSKKFVQVRYFDVWHKGEAIQLLGEVSLPPELTYGETFPPLRIHGQVTTEVANVEARSSFDEGELGASIDLARTNDDAAPYAKVIFRAGAMPLSIFNEFLKKLGVLTNTKFHPKFLWLSCDVSSEGPLNQLIKHTPLKVDNCSVEGDAGRIEIGPALRNQENVWLPFKIDIKHFNLQDLVNMFSEKGPSGILSSFGTIRGVISYEGKDQQSFKGALDGAEIYFSNRNVRAIQHITTVDLEAKRANGKVNGEITNITLDPGKFTGGVSFVFDDKFADGTMNINTFELALDPKIEELMADGQFNELSLKGDLSVRDHKISDWKGTLQAASYTGRQLRITKPVVETKFANGRFDISAQAGSGELSPESQWLEWVKRATGEINITSRDEKTWIPISNIKAQISVEKQTIGWKSATLTASQSKVQVTSTGEIRENTQAAGLLTTIEPGKKPRKFVITGSPKNPQLSEQ